MQPSGCRPFRSPVPHEPHPAPSPPPPHRTGRADLLHPALRRTSPAGPRRPWGSGFAGAASSFRDRRTLAGVARPRGQSPGSWSLPQRVRSQAPSLHRRYPASAVLWACPTPPPARPVPRGRPVGSRTHWRRSPVLRSISLCRHAVATTPVGPPVGIGSLPGYRRQRPSPGHGRVGSHIEIFEACSAFTRVTAYLLAESLNDPLHRRLRQHAPSTTAPIATGWNDSCRVGIAPTEDRRLCTAHNVPFSSSI